MKSLKMLAAGTALVAGATVTGTAFAEVSGNIGVASQYVFRGLVFGDPQVSGGVDYAGEGGIYAGTWISSSGGVQEVDVYGGWANDMFDLGYVFYYFPDVDTGADAHELYAGLNLSNLSAYLYYSPSGFVANGADDEYVYGSLDFALPMTEKMDLTLHLGATEGIGDDVKDDDTLFDYGVTAGFGDLFIMASAISEDANGQVANEPTFTVGYGWSFDDIM